MHADKERLAFQNALYLCKHTLGLNSAANRRRRAARLGLSPEGAQIDEHLAILTNSKTQLKAAAILAKAAKDANAHTTVLHYRDGESEESLPLIAEAVRALGAEWRNLDYLGDADKKRISIQAFSQGDFDAAIRLVTDSVALTDELAFIAAANGTRMPEMPGLTIDSLASPVFAESAELMEQRRKSLLGILSRIVRFHITSGDGTNLIVEVNPSEPWPSEPYDYSGPDEHGAVPVDNLPAGELYKNTLVSKTTGILVLYYLDTYVDSKAIVDVPVILRFHEGRLVSIAGGISADKLRSYLLEKSKEDDDPTAACRLTEIAFGLNYRARTYEEGNVPTLEAEKYPRLHVALGDSPVMDPCLANATNFVFSQVHLDFVLPRIHVVEVTFDDGSRQVLFGPAGSLERYGKV